MTQNALEITTVGLPFCAFKIITGLHIYSTFENSSLKLLGLFFIIFGVFDLIVNGLNLLSVVALRKRITATCMLSFLSKLYSKRSTLDASSLHDFGTSLDVLIAFILVAMMVGFSQIAQLPRTQINIWNLAVVFNVLGAGLARISYSYSGLRKS
jgi:hypothetical protein